MSDDLFGMLGDEEDEDNTTRKRKNSGKHKKSEDDDEGDDNEFAFSGKFIKNLTKNKWLLFGVIAAALIIIAIIVVVLILFWPYVAKFAKTINFTDIVKSFLG